LATGGIGEGIEVAAQLAIVGLDPLRFLYAKDEFERQLMLHLGKKMSKWQQQRDHNLAVDIANQVGKLFKT
jgi:hypothetical protein